MCGKGSVTTRRTCFSVLSTYKNVGKRRASVRAHDARNRSRPNLACRPHSYTLRNRATDVRRCHSFPTFSEKNVADVASHKTYGQKARTASCDRGLKATSVTFFSENVGKEWRLRTSLARHSHGCTKCKSVVCTPSLAVSGCVHRFRTEAVLTTHGCPAFAHVLARRQHAEARTAGCDRGFSLLAQSSYRPEWDVLRESAGRCAGLPSGECGTSSGRVRYVLRESAVRPAGECGTFCGSQTFCSSLLEQRKLEVNDLRPACKQDWTGSGCNIKGAGGFC
ncbi:hypothetical protein Bbelb_143660 [Branchiostoma belcheri]|nr:hypothetical protein Bbelb_143660 [Branchiostoma belcheri]